MTVTTFSLKKDGEKYLSDNFQVKEFRCKDGSDKILISLDTIKVLQAVRNYFGQPITITSGYRTPSHNKVVGGASKSQHVYGTAADFKVKNVPPKAVVSYLEKYYPKHGIGLYSSWTHVDSRGYKVYWKNSGSATCSTFGLGNTFEKYRSNDSPSVAPTENIKQENNAATTSGIDISKHNGTVDYSKVVKAIDFAILRVGYGVEYLPNKQKDVKFEDYYAGLSGKIPLGVYYYSYANAKGEGKQEADNCLKYLGDKKLELPIFYDLEDSSMKEIETVAREFVDTIKNAGYKPGIYCNSYWAKTKIDLSKFTDCTIWIADYGKNDGKPHSKALNCDIWQYSSVGKVDGISGVVDVNIAYNLDIKASSQDVSTVKSNKIITVKSIQQWLNPNYNSGLVEDGIYGARTKKALVKAVQSNIGTTADGIFGKQSASKWQTVKRGSKGALPRLCQMMLICQSYAVGSSGADGIIGSDSVTAIKDFQDKNGLSVDGIIGKQTASKLFG